jgi:hypothetical protein
MKARLYAQYKKDGSPRYIYVVDCTPAEKAQIKVAKGDNYKEVEDDGTANAKANLGKPMLWTKKRHEENSDVRVTDQGGVFIDNSFVDDVQSLIESYPEGSSMRRALENQGAQLLFSKLVGGKKTSSSVSAPVASAPAEASAESTDLSDTK